MDKYNNYSYFPSFPCNLLLLPNVASGTEQVLFLCFSWFTTHTKAHKHMLTTLLEHQTQPPFCAPPQSSRIHTSRVTFIRLTIKSSNSTVLEKRWKTERLISIKRRKHDLTFPKPQKWLIVGSFSVEFLKTQFFRVPPTRGSHSNEVVKEGGRPKGDVISPIGSNNRSWLGVPNPAVPN